MDFLVFDQRNVARYGLTMLLTILLVFANTIFVQAYAPAAEDAHTRVLVQFEAPPNASDAAFVRGLGGEVVYTYSLVPAMAVEIPVRALPGLEHNPRVKLVEPDTEVQAMVTTPVGNITDEYGETWSIDNVQARPVHISGNTGQGVKVGIIDSGVSTHHRDLTVVDGYDFVDGDSDPDDVYGHGTHVAGTVCAALDGYGAVGVAPDCALYSLRVLNSSGSGSTSGILAAVDWAAGNNPGNVKLDVINLSLGSRRDPGSTAKAVYDAAYDAGVLIVAAAGNSGNSNGKGTNTIYPANYSSVIAVAATDINDDRASFSSTGDNVELAAPGYSVFSTWNDNSSHYDPQPVCFGTAYDCYKDGSGTSMASPQVAGVAALIIAAGQALGETLTNTQVRTILGDTARDLGNVGRDPQYGVGLVDANAAVAAVVPAGPQAPVADAGGSQTLSDDGDGFEGIFFDASGSYDPDGTIISYEWAIDGITQLFGELASTTFAADGVAHTVTLTVTDNDGDTDTDTITVTVNPYITPPPASFELTAAGYKVKGMQKVDLSWTGSSATDFTLTRDGGTPVSLTDTDSPYTDNIDQRGGGSYSYELCEAGTTVCTTAVITF